MTKLFDEYCKRNVEVVAKLENEIAVLQQANDDKDLALRENRGRVFQHPDYDNFERMKTQLEVQINTN